MSDTFGKANRATPAATLEQQILDPNHPKNDREWWAADEITRLRAEVEQASQQLGDILAIIHRDGGHHTADVGIEQSVKDAHIKWANLMTENERLTAERDRQYDQNAEQIIRIAAIEAENSSLSSWQCVYTDGKTGLVGDEYGNQYCAMAKMVEALRAENEKLREEIKHSRQEHAILVENLDEDIERLRGQAEFEKKCRNDAFDELKKQDAENEKLRAALDEAQREITQLYEDAAGESI